MNTRTRRPGASVRWHARTTSTEEEIATYYTGPYKVSVSDCDGDCSNWAIYHYEVKSSFDKERHSALASGEVPDGETDRYHFDIAKDIAISALRAIQAERTEDEQ